MSRRSISLCMIPSAKLAWEAQPCQPLSCLKTVVRLEAYKVSHREYVEVEACAFVLLKGDRGCLPLSAALYPGADCWLCPADGPAPNPQALLNSLGSVVAAASSVANAQEAVTSAASGSGNGNILQSAGSAAQALEVRSYPFQMHAISPQIAQLPDTECVARLELPGQGQEGPDSVQRDCSS